MHKWKQAIQDELEACGLDSLSCRNDPKKALYHIIRYNTECAYNEALNRNKWKEALIEELSVCHIYRIEHENNPRTALKDIIIWHVQTADYFNQQEKWYRKFWYKIQDIWYGSSLAYKLWKICGSKQPPF